MKRPGGPVARLARLFFLGELGRCIDMLRRTIIFLAFGALSIPAFTVLADPPADTDDFVFLDNSHLKLGVKKSSGAGIAWLSASGSERNLINHFDRGRLVQQSYYGKEDGSLW